MEISDDIFRVELDRHMKACGKKKADRNKEIEQVMHIATNRRNNLLDNWKRCANIYKREQANKNRMPTEAEEQALFVEWFKQAFPQDKIVMIRNDGSRSAAEKTGQMVMGLCPGASDLYIPRWHIWLEMKRIKGYSVSKNQSEFAEYAQSIGDWYMLGIGFEDAKTKVLNVINASNLLSK